MAHEHGAGIFQQYAGNNGNENYAPSRSSTESKASSDGLPELVDPDAIRTSAPEERFRLGYGTVMGLVFNRSIGTGIYLSPGLMYLDMRSTGLSLVFWGIGIVYAASGVVLYIEYGLNTPRRKVNDKDVGIPRNGGEINYLRYVYTAPAYRRGQAVQQQPQQLEPIPLQQHPETALNRPAPTPYMDSVVPYITTLFGITFIFFGTMGANAIQFGINVQSARSGQGQLSINHDNARGIAIGISILACFVHTLSRRGGLLLNNFFAIVKVGILLLIVLLAILSSAGVLASEAQIELLQQQVSYRNANLAHANVMDQNLDISNSFVKSVAGTIPFHHYGDAFLRMLYAFSGLGQANYVLGEIDHPHKKFPIGLAISGGSIAVLYFVVNVGYWTVVPKSLVDSGVDVAEAFFTITLGALSNDPILLGRRIAASLIATSALGNVIVMTYTATRVKQEIAKEGFLPWPRFFASNYDLSLGRLLKWLLRDRSAARWRLFRSKWFDPDNFQEKTPVGATILHLGTCFILIFSTWGCRTAYESANILSGLAAYTIACFFRVLMAVGMLYLRFRKSKDWSTKSNVPAWLSVSAAVLQVLLNLFPLITKWWPVTDVDVTTAWYVIPLVSCVTFGVATLWWIIFFLKERRKDRRTNTVLVVEKVPELEPVAGQKDKYVQTHETVYICRRGRDFDGDFEQGRADGNGTGGVLRRRRTGEERIS